MAVTRKVGELEKTGGGESSDSFAPAFAGGLVATTVPAG
jgi:hypothetical protein